MRKKYSLGGSASTPQKPAQTPASGGLAIESMSIDQILVGRAVLSVEEEVVALQEADELQGEVVDGIAEAERVEDVTDAMLNIADTVEEVDQLTPQQAMLIENASEVAVAGTDTSPDDVIPPMEDLIGEGKEVALESFVEDMRRRAGEIWARIRQFVIDLWAKITAFFKRIFATAPRHLARIKELRDVIAAKKKGGNAKAKSETVQVMVGTTALSYPSYMVRNANDLNKGIGELQKLSDWVYGQYLKNVKVQGDMIATELKKFDPNKAAESLATVARGLPKANFNNVLKSPGTGYMGCFDLHVVRIEKDKIQGLSDSQVLNALRHTKIVLESRDGAAPAVTREGFATMSFEEMEAVLKSVEGVLKKVVGYETSSDYKALESTRQALMEGGNAATAAMGKMNGNDEAGKMQRMFALEVMKSLQNFNTTFTGWASNLTVPMSKKLINVSRASLVLVEKSLAQYA